MLLQVSRAFYGKLARLYRTHWLEAAGAPAAGCSIGLPMGAAAARLAELEAAAGAAGRQGPGGSEKGGVSASLDASASDEGSDEDGEAGEGTIAGGVRSGDAAMLGAESRIAEVEAAAAAAATTAAGAEESSGGGSSSSSSLRAEFHQRMFALLLRYKSLQGAGFQVRGQIWHVGGGGLLLGCSSGTATVAVPARLSGLCCWGSPL